jgi:hypothetical protein
MDIDKLRFIDLPSICALFGLAPDPSDPKQFKNTEFRLCLNGYKWFDHSAGQGGGGAVDLIMHLKHLPFMAACSYLNNASGELSPTIHTAAATTRAARATRPPAANNDHLPAVLDYLTIQRGLNVKLIEWCINRGFIYADSRRNCVFMYGEKGAELRGTGSMQWRSIYGTIEHGFILPARNAVGVAVLESAIDALSYRQLHHDVIAVSIAGNSNHRIINQAIGIAKANNLPVLSAFDNDSGGNIADKTLSDCAAINEVEIMQDRPIKKDWNEVLKSLINGI